MEGNLSHIGLSQDGVQPRPVNSREASVPQRDGGQGIRTLRSKQLAAAKKRREALAFPDMQNIVNGGYHQNNFTQEIPLAPSERNVHQYQNYPPAAANQDFEAYPQDQAASSLHHSLQMSSVSSFQYPGNQMPQPSQMAPSQGHGFQDIFNQVPNAYLSQAAASQISQNTQWTQARPMSQNSPMPFSQNPQCTQIGPPSQRSAQPFPQKQQWTESSQTSQDVTIFSEYPVHQLAAQLQLASTQRACQSSQVISTKPCGNNFDTAPNAFGPGYIDCLVEYLKKWGLTLMHAYPASSLYFAELDGILIAQGINSLAQNWVDHVVFLQRVRQCALPSLHASIKIAIGACYMIGPSHVREYATLIATVAVHRVCEKLLLPLVSEKIKTHIRFCTEAVLAELEATGHRWVGSVDPGKEKERERESSADEAPGSKDGTWTKEQWERMKPDWYETLGKESSPSVETDSAATTSYTESPSAVGYEVQRSRSSTKMVEEELELASPETMDYSNVPAKQEGGEFSFAWPEDMQGAFPVPEDESAAGQEAQEFGLTKTEVPGNPNELEMKSTRSLPRVRNTSGLSISQSEANAIGEIVASMPTAEAKLKFLEQQLPALFPDKAV